MTELRSDTALFERLGEPVVKARFETDSPIVIDVNPAFEAVFGYNRADIIGESLDEYIVPPDAESTASLLNQQTQDGEPIEREVRRQTADGLRWFLFRSVPLEEDGTKVGYGIYIDITARKQQEARFQELLRHSSDIISILDEDAVYTYQSQSSRTILGYDPSELLGTCVFDYIHPDDREVVVETYAQSLEQSGPTPEVRYRFQHADGSWLWLESIGNNQLENPAVRGFVINSRDITSRIERERELELLKAVYTRVFRHNIRNELTVANGHAELLGDYLDGPGEESLRSLKASIERVLKHTTKARRIQEVVDTPETREIELVERIEGVLEGVKREHPGVEFSVDLPVSQVIVAHPKVDDAIAELIDNAIRHAPAQHMPTIRIWLRRPAETVKLCIEDDSDGMSQAEIDAILQGREEDLHHASGVGLWLVRWIVTNSDGSIMIEQTADGTRVELSFLPADEPED